MSAPPERWRTGPVARPPLGARVCYVEIAEWPVYRLGYGTFAGVTPQEPSVWRIVNNGGEAALIAQARVFLIEQEPGALSEVKALTAWARVCAVCPVTPTVAGNPHHRFLRGVRARCFT